ncbi:adventitious rooting related oxygenase family protein [Salix suchowensis]|uniref:2-oxoglutarate-dependent dioxygenase DAO n=1 Tax=Salix koriyanagi TaxID=2511006 RepID=A0A9Q0UD28_9ROSI|nr:adventitious rooting related oxygenase family protein [Salix suchowensis]KAJ6727824.1 2-OXOGLUTARATE (2OG) AND FE(II)-DEPENDENT OXYGENASE SUPERFAMILY PROTEIN-RELATED [Salix koriyanagi]
MGESGVPVIDLHEFPGQYEKLRRACVEWGCFRIVNHSISSTLMADMKRVVGSLLDLPFDVKNRNIDVIAGSGYMAPSKVNPLYEALGLYDIGSSQAVETFCAQLDASPYQREVIEMYAKAIHGAAMDIARKLAESMGLNGNLFESWISQFRINKYSFTPETIGSSGVQIHTDSGFLTILQDDENVGGLEVMDPSGVYIAVDPSPGTLLVNLGDIATAWSNGRLRNVKHRVQCKESTIRISIASFLVGPRDEVEAPPELVDSEHPRLYVSFTYEDYRKLRLTTKLPAGEALELKRIQS